MQSFQSWAMRTEPVLSLKLDPLNPRLTRASASADTRELLAELLEHEKVEALARDIADQGYFPTEVLVGITEADGSSIIIEGNRRLAALKLLLAPESAPEAHRKTFERLHARIDPKQLRLVLVAFAPSREDAAPIIVRRHARNGINAWDPAQQVRYLRSLFTDQMSIEGLADLVGWTVGEVTEKLKMDGLYQQARRLDLPDELKRAVINEREFGYSTFQRLMENQKVQTMLGLVFDDRAQPKSTRPVEAFDKMFKRLVSDVASGKENTRTLNNSDDFDRYFKTLSDVVPEEVAVEPHELSPSPSVKPGAEEAQTKKPASKPAARKKSAVPSSSLIPKSLHCELKHPRVVAVFTELRRLRAKEFPNVWGVMLRVLLELLVARYVDKTGLMKKLRETTKANEKGKDWSPTLKQMLALLLQEGQPDIGPQVRKRLQKMISDPAHYLALDEMDQFVHSYHVPPTEAHLRSLWTQLEPLIEALVVEPAPAAPASKPAAPASKPAAPKSAKPQPGKK